MIFWSLMLQTQADDQQYIEREKKRRGENLVKVCHLYSLQRDFTEARRYKNFKNRGFYPKKGKIFTFWEIHELVLQNTQPLTESYNL